MADIRTCSIEVLAGHSHAYRGVGVLVCDNKQFNARQVIDKLPESQRRRLWTSFDYWISGKINNNRYHGWDKSSFGGAYVYCFVFKWPNDRLYGFLCHPNNRNLRYQLCVLVLHDNKKENETDETNLRKVENVRKDSLVQKATMKPFEYKSRGQQL